VRRVRDVDLRLGEAVRLGFASAVVPLPAPGADGGVRTLDGMRVVELSNLWRALKLLHLLDPEKPANLGVAST
jgi:DNA repair protein RadA/Sms